MPTYSSVDSQAETGQSTGPDDDFLVTGLKGGDAAALNKLMDRYDRLVRYTVFRSSRNRCLQDPHWLESIASATWTGFVESVRRNPDHPPKSVRAYLVRIARNKVVNALRRSRPDTASLDGDTDISEQFIATSLEEPVEILARLELLEMLRACLGELGAEDRTMMTQLQAITERRWQDAAQALGMRESTLRSRWGRVLSRLRERMGRKSGAASFAPGPSNYDL